MVILLCGADSKADGGKRRMIDGARFRHL